MKRKKLVKIVSSLFILGMIATVIYFKFSSPTTRYYTPKPLAVHYNGEAYVGSETCMECHPKIYESHRNARHFKTSSRPTSSTIKASFKEGENELLLSDARLVMTADNNTFWQHAQPRGFNADKEYHWPIAIVVGSGLKGQTYLTSKNKRLFQLQASYYTPTDSWVNSPNYNNTLTPLRPVNNQCLKCHVTFAEKLGPAPENNSYNLSKIVLGVDCEKCHGPSEKHVTYHKNNSEDKTPAFMVAIDSLSRQQNLDICASCHSGLRNQTLENPFKFLPGDTLAKFSKNYSFSKPSAQLDVHGNQYGLLTSSKCFKASTQMNCITCHDPHSNQRDQTAYFNSKCIQCHSAATTSCSVDTEKMMASKANCIACHMPLKQSKSMQIQLGKNQKIEPVSIRTHLIAIYGDDISTLP